MEEPYSKYNMKCNININTSEIPEVKQSQHQYFIQYSKCNYHKFMGCLLRPTPH